MKSRGQVLRRIGLAAGAMLLTFYASCLGTFVVGMRIERNKRRRASAQSS